MNTKEILLEAIKNRVKDTGIIKIVLVFNLKESTYNVMMKVKDVKDVKVELTDTEVNTVKKLLIRRIESAWNSKFAHEAEAIMIEVNLEIGDINTYIKTSESGSNLFKFDYLKS